MAKTTLSEDYTVKIMMPDKKTKAILSSTWNYETLHDTYGQQNLKI